MSSMELDRRRFLTACAAAGAGGLFPGALWTLASQARAAGVESAPRVTEAMIAEAARIAGIDLPQDVRAAMLAGLGTALDDFEAVRKLRIPNSVSPAFTFDP